MLNVGDFATQLNFISQDLPDFSIFYDSLQCMCFWSNMCLCVCTYICKKTSASIDQLGNHASQYTCLKVNIAVTFDTQNPINYLHLGHNTA